MTDNKRASAGNKRDCPFPYSTTREALGSRIEGKSYFKKEAVHEAGWRTYYFLGYVGELARMRAMAGGRKTVNHVDIMDVYQLMVKLNPPRKLIDDHSDYEYY